MSDRLIADGVDGALTPDEESALERACADDPACAAEFAAQMTLHAILPAALAGPHEADAMARAVVAQISARGGSTRVARQVVRRIRRRRWAGWPVAAAATLLVGISLLVWLARQASAVPEAAPRAWCVAAERADLDIASAAARVRVFPGTRYRLAQEGVSGPAVEVEAGRLEVAIDRHLAAPFTIATPSATASVLGTAFSLEVSAQETALEVQRGQVRLAGSGGAVHVGAGRGARCAMGSAPGTPAMVGSRRPLFDQIDPASGPDGWRTESGPGGSIAFIPSTAAGGSVAVQTGVGTAAWSWFGRAFDQLQDWSGGDGIAFSIRADGSAVMVEAAGDRADDGTYAWTSAAVQLTQSGWHEVMVPFSAFTGHPNHPGQSVPISRILGVVRHIGFFPKDCRQVEVRDIRLYHSRK